MKYKVYFEIFGKKMVTTIQSDSKDQAKEIVKSKIIFRKIEPDLANINPADVDFDNIMDILGIKPKK